MSKHIRIAAVGLFVQATVGFILTLAGLVTFDSDKSASLNTLLAGLVICVFSGIGFGVHIYFFINPLLHEGKMKISPADHIDGGAANSTHQSQSQPAPISSADEPLKHPAVILRDTLVSLQESTTDLNTKQSIEKCIRICKETEGLWKTDIEHARKLLDRRRTNDDTANYLLSVLVSKPQLVLSRSVEANSGDNAAGDKENIVHRRVSFVQGAMADADQKILGLLNNLLDWRSNIFELDEATSGRALTFAGLEIIRSLNLLEVNDIDAPSLLNFLNAIQDGYLDNPYHNSIHGADVAQSTAYFITRPKLKAMLSQFEKFAAVFAALCHDYKHTGTTNNFLINTRDPIAIAHNDDSPLERMHVAETFKVMVGDRDLARNWDRSKIREFRSMVIDMILCTDLKTGMGIIHQFSDVCDDFTESISSKEKMLLLKVTLRVADVAHPAKIQSVHMKWTDLINEEFLTQGDREREMGMDISPLCDRAKFKLAKAQQGFINFLVKPTFQKYCEFIEDSLPMEIIQENFDMWVKMEETNGDDQKNEMVRRASILSE